MPEKLKWNYTETLPTPLMDRATAGYTSLFHLPNIVERDKPPKTSDGRGYRDKNPYYEYLTDKLKEEWRLGQNKRKNFDTYYNKYLGSDPLYRNNELKWLAEYLAFIESRWNPLALNEKTNAKGLFLIMPQYWGDKNSKNIEDQFLRYKEMMNINDKGIINLMKSGKVQRSSIAMSRLRNGYDANAMRAIAWLSGLGGLEGFLLKGLNRSDGNTTLALYAAAIVARNLNNPKPRKEQQLYGYADDSEDENTQLEDLSQYEDLEPAYYYDDEDDYYTPQQAEYTPPQDFDFNDYLSNTEQVGNEELPYNPLLDIQMPEPEEPSPLFLSLNNYTGEEDDYDYDNPKDFQSYLKQRLALEAQEQAMRLEELDAPTALNQYVELLLEEPNKQFTKPVILPLLAAKGGHLYDDGGTLYNAWDNVTLSPEGNIMIGGVPYTIRALNREQYPEGLEVIGTDKFRSFIGKALMNEILDHSAYSGKTYGDYSEGKDKAKQHMLEYAMSHTPEETEQYRLNTIAAGLALAQGNPYPAYGLDNMFANMLTGTLASTELRAAKKIKEGNYLEGGLEAASPFLFNSGPIGNMARSIYGGYHLLNENGLQKTGRELLNGNYWNAAKSFAGDLGNALLAGVGAYGMTNDALNLAARLGSADAKSILFARALNGDISSTGYPVRFGLPQIERITRSVLPDGTIKLSLPTHTKSNPRLFVLNPQGNNKFYVHMKTWDGDHIPANLTNEEKQALFQALYNELPDGAEILLPLSNEKYLATRGTVAGMRRLERDPRFVPGSPGSFQYRDKNDVIRTFNGTSFIKTGNNEGVTPKYLTIPEYPKWDTYKQLLKQKEFKNQFGITSYDGSDVDVIGLLGPDTWDLNFIIPYSMSNIRTRLPETKGKVIVDNLKPGTLYRNGWKLIEERMKAPAGIYVSNDATKGIKGFHDPDTGKSFVGLKEYMPLDIMKNTRRHEVMGHGTENEIQQLAGQKAMLEYYDLTDELALSGLKLSSQGSLEPEELRALMFLTRDNLMQAFRNYKLAFTGKKITQKDIDTFREGVNLLDKDLVAQAMSNLGSSYAVDYTALLNKKPELLDKFKHLISYGLAVGAPVGIGYTMQNNAPSNNPNTHALGGTLFDDGGEEESLRPLPTPWLTFWDRKATNDSYLDYKYDPEWQELLNTYDEEIVPYEIEEEENFPALLPWLGQENIEGIGLPTVTVSPRFEDMNTSYRMQNAIPDSILRNKLYSYLAYHGNPDVSSLENSNRFLEVMKEAGNPTVVAPEEEDLIRAFYLPWKNTMVIGYDPDGAHRYSDIISELSHAYAFNSPLAELLHLAQDQGYLESVAEAIDKLAEKYPVLERPVTEYFDSDLEDIYGNDGYSRLGNDEFNAHSLIQGPLDDYISGYTDEYKDAIRENTEFAIDDVRKNNPENEDIFSSFKGVTEFGDGGTTIGPGVIITPDEEYNRFLNTLPDNQRLTPDEDYDTYLYWKLNGKPKNFQEALSKGMYAWDASDNSYHGNSIAWGDDGTGYFIKPKHHDTLKYELDWFNKNIITEPGGHQRFETPEERAESDKFRNNYILADDPTRPNFYIYTPRNLVTGLHIYRRPNEIPIFPILLL